MEKLYQHIIPVWAVYHPVDILLPVTSPGGYSHVSHLAYSHIVTPVPEHIPARFLYHSI